MLVAQQAADVLKVRWAALPQPLALLGLQIQHIQEGFVALRRRPSPCISHSASGEAQLTTKLGFLSSEKAKWQCLFLRGMHDTNAKNNP